MAVLCNCYFIIIYFIRVEIYCLYCSGWFLKIAHIVKGEKGTNLNFFFFLEIVGFLCGWASVCEQSAAAPLLLGGRVQASTADLPQLLPALYVGRVLRGQHLPLTRNHLNLILLPRNLRRVLWGPQWAGRKWELIAALLHISKDDRNHFERKFAIMNIEFCEFSRFMWNHKCGF